MMEFEVPLPQTNNVTVGIPVELCGLCSTYYEKPSRSFTQPYVNRLICKVLDVEPPPLLSYFNQYISLCPDCTNRVKTYDKKRIELDILRQEIVSCVLDTLLHIRPNDKSPLHSLKYNILERWAKESLPSSILNSISAEKSSLPKPTEQGKEPSSTPLQKSPRTSNSQHSGKTQHTHKERLKEYLQKRQSKESTTVSKTTTPDCASDHSLSAEVQSDTSIIKSDSSSVQEIEQPANSNCLPESDHTSPSSSVWQVEIGNEVNITTESGPEQFASETSNYITGHIKGDLDQECSENEDDDLNNDGEQEQSGDDSYENTIPVVQLSDPDYQKCVNETGGSPKRRKLNEVGANAKSGKIRIRKPPPPKAPQHQKMPFFCEACGWVFSKLQTLRRHVGSESCTGPDEDTVIECSICSADFTSSTWLDLKFHVDEKHGNVSLDKCRLCKKEFMPNTITWHNCEGLDNIPQVIKEFPCDYCDKLYHTSGSLSKHMYRKHISSSDDKRFKCEICYRTFISNSIMIVHKATHKDEEVFLTCCTCGIRLPSTGSLREHMKCHTADAEKQYACEICGKRFRFKTLLSIHGAVHTDEKKYSCDICENKFKTYSTMQRHWKRHLNPLPGKRELCPICKCGTKYTKSKTLKNHMLAKHPGTSEQFDICSRPDDPDEELIYSQCKIPVEKLKVEVRRTKRVKGKSVGKKNLDSSSEESEEDVEEGEMDIDSEFDKDNKTNSEKATLTNIKCEMNIDSSGEIPAEPIPSTHTMSTRHGVKRVIIGTKEIKHNS